MTIIYEAKAWDQEYIYSQLVDSKEKEVADMFFGTIKEQEQ